MARTVSFTRGHSPADREFIVGLGRAFAGALIFSLPMLMTMEMWWLGFYMDPWRLALLLVLAVPLLVGLSHYGGFKPTARLLDDVVDAFVALLVAAAAAVFILYIFGVLTFDMSAREIIGKITLQAVPGSIGAMLARSQLGEEKGEEQQRKEHPSYWGGNEGRAQAAHRRELRQLGVVHHPFSSLGRATRTALILPDSVPLAS
jgi:putative integral membrane protein (TIGR02587 family)